MVANGSPAPETVSVRPATSVTYISGGPGGSGEGSRGSTGVVGMIFLVMVPVNGRGIPKFSAFATDPLAAARLRNQYLETSIEGAIAMKSRG